MLSMLKTKHVWYSGTASRMLVKSLSFCSRFFLVTWVRLKIFERLDFGMVDDGSPGSFQGL